MALAPNKQYKAVVYNRGVVDVYPLLVVEGINLTPKIVYEGPENDVLSYKWLTNETLEVKTAPDGATDPNPYSKPFIVSIKDNK